MYDSFSSKSKSYNTQHLCTKGTTTLYTNSKVLYDKSTSIGTGEKC